MTVTFCGHGDCHGNKEVKNWLRETVEALIQRGADDFLSGSYGAFDAYTTSVVRDLKLVHPHIYSPLAFPYLDRKVDATIYDDTFYPPLEKVPKRYAISKRNEYMVNKADIVVAYVIHSWGGAATTLAYAKHKGKEIINYGTF